MKNIRILFLLILFTFCSAAVSQINQVTKSTLADSLRDSGNMPGAASEYSKMLQKDNNNAAIIINLAIVYSIDEKLDSCFKYLNRYLSCKVELPVLTNPNLMNARADERWKNFENSLVELYCKNTNTVFKDIDYAKKLWKLMALDQAYFYEIGLAVRKVGPYTPVVRALAKLKNNQNKLNQKELEELISKKGWPKKSEVGESAALAAFYVFQHSDGELQKKYVPLMKQRCEENEASWYYFALFSDRMNVNLNQPQRYGTQPLFNSVQNDVFEIAPLEDEDKVDEWRKEVGLPPFREMLKQNNMVYKFKKNSKQ